jgi:hypothetical protein
MFGFETTPDIYHGFFFQMEPYFKNHVELKLKLNLLNMKNIQKENKIMK